MSTIGGPGGIGGPKGPGGPSGPGGPDASEGPDAAAGVDDVRDVRDVSDAGQVAGTRATGGPGEIDALAADVATGAITRREAVDRLVDSMAGPELGASERAELRELLSDLVDSDPYLGSLVGRI